MLELVLESGANPNSMHASPFPPYSPRPVLLHASLNNDVQSVHMLLGFRADPGLDFGGGVTTLDYLNERNNRFPSEATSSSIMNMLRTAPSHLDEEAGEDGAASITEDDASEVAHTGDAATDGADAAASQVPTEVGTASAISAAPADNAIAPPQVDATQQATASAVMADAAAAGTAPRFAELRHSTKEKSIFLLCAGDAETFGRWWLLGNPAQIRILVDKNHCQAWMAHNGSVFVRDLNTTHGTVVGGHRLKRGETRELFAGESISFGETNPFVSLFFRADATPPPAAHASSLGDDAPPLSACLESFFQGAQPPDEPPDELASVVSLVSVFSRLGASPALSSAELHRGAAVMREAASMLGYDPGEEDAEEAEKDEDMEGGEHDEDGEEDAVFGSGCPLSSEEEKEEDDDEEANENILE